MSNIKYLPCKKIQLGGIHNEKWLQDRIEKNPEILGLGEINVLQRERTQSTKGRIDFLCSDPDLNTMYEIEVMLGSTDESHIIRTIEYWDIEKRKNPSRDHKAVIVAENITNRFFNVISLMNRSIPIIAIQLNALQVGNKLTLDFTKVLDTYESPEDEIDMGGEIADRPFWEKKSGKKSIALMDELIGISKEHYKDVKITYNKYHVALGTERRNVMWFRPRKREGYLQFDIKVGQNNVDSVKNILEEIGIPPNIRQKDEFSVVLLQKDFEEHRDRIAEIIRTAINEYS